MHCQYADTAAEKYRTLPAVVKVMAITEQWFTSSGKSGGKIFSFMCKQQTKEWNK